MFEKSKMFIYKEDFHKFIHALQETLDHIKEDLMPDYDFDQPEQRIASTDSTPDFDKDDGMLDEGSSLKWD